MKPHQIPEPYDDTLIKRGLQVLSDYKQPRGISLDKAIPRDDRMYNFDKETIKDIKKKLKKKDFNFSDYLPNSIKNDYTSRNSLASTAQSLAN